MSFYVGFQVMAIFLIIGCIAYAVLYFLFQLFRLDRILTEECVEYQIELEEQLKKIQ